MFDPLGVTVSYEIIQAQRVLLAAFCVLIAFRANTIKTQPAKRWAILLAIASLLLASYLLINANYNQATPTNPFKLWNIIPNICYIYTLFAIGGILSALEHKKEV
jgi:xanthine/uracil permease